MRLDFIEDGHKYLLDGVEIPSLSAILKPLSGYDHVRPDVLNAAAYFGTAVHQTTELHDLHDLDEASLDPALYDYLAGWKNFKQDNNVEIFEVEPRCASTKYRYACTPDRVLMIGGKKLIGEIKTTSVLMPTVALQTAAQQLAYEEWKGGKLTGRIAIQLNPDFPRGYKIKKYTSLNDFNVFVAALTIYNWRATHE